MAAHKENATVLLWSLAIMTNGTAEPRGRRDAAAASAVRPDASLFSHGFLQKSPGVLCSPHPDYVADDVGLFSGGGAALIKSLDEYIRNAIHSDIRGAKREEPSSRRAPSLEGCRVLRRAPGKGSSSFICKFDA